jgi:Zn-dependent protease/predicted transcriptional regulator
MRWSLKLGRFAGIDVYLHATFGILLVWIGASELTHAGNVATAALTLLFVIALFVTVVLHEYGHALTARRFGIRTRDITLYPIGGVARLERMPERPRDELLVALAGPAVNVVIAVGLFALMAVLGLKPHLSQSSPSTTFVASLAVANLLIAGFNLIPAFPMDGGRALRALLAMRLDYVRATKIAARLGQGLALVFLIVGLFASPILVFIALFVWMAATSEAYVTETKANLEGIPVGAAMITSFQVLSPHDPITRAAEFALHGFQHDFPVVDRNRVIGVVRRERLLEALVRGEHGQPVATAMNRDFVTAEPNEMLFDVMTKLGECRCRSLPVMQQGRLVGMITMDSIGELLAAQRSSSRRTPLGQVHPTAWASWWHTSSRPT